ncbi:uncharacterized protein LOC106130856 [Amyelois transitella]|uniref:uncharacterized protein LOC106130856 n=1 Tax=Amyelois transitella TaxID=680683 RepID=UPI00298F49E9|nr:uncharacterized protein LOC106130856 [Amyelois transitella]
MYRVLVATVLLAAVWADNEGDVKKCMRIFHPRSMHCCKREHSLKPPMHDHSAVKECMHLQGGKPTCEREICMASKQGVASNEGKIDKAAVQKKFETDFENDPELLKLLKDNCIDGDFSKYGKEDDCDVLKLKMCMEIQMTASCPEWDNEGHCEGIQELVEECIEKFA